MQSSRPPSGKMSSSISTHIEISHAKKSISDLGRKKEMASNSLLSNQKKLEALVQHICYLKNDPEVVIVSIQEFRSLLEQRNSYTIKVAIWEEAIKQLDDNIKLLQERLHLLELESKESEPEPEPEPLAQILEFPSDRTKA